jgi:hypothetical protein
MSLYNALFGVNPMAGVCMEALGVKPDGVPRFRDCYMTEDGKIAIHTRTGGGNRPMYESEESARRNYPEYFDGENDPPVGPWNADLRNLPGFEYDEDDDFDSTYATFYYTPTDAWKPIFAAMSPLAAGETPRSRWERVLADLQASGGPSTEEGKRALAVGERILGSISTPS